MRQEQLSAALLERAEIRIHRIHVTDGLVDDRHVSVEVEFLPVEIRIVERDANDVEHAAGRLIRAAQRRYRIAERLAGKDQFAFRVLHAAVERVDRSQLRRRQARVVVFACGAQQLREVHCALSRIVQESFLEGVAGVGHHLIHERRLLGREAAFRMTRQLDASRDARGPHVDVAVRQQSRQ